jgi:hypothetical protein
MLRAALELLLQVGFSGFLEAKVCLDAGFSCSTLILKIKGKFGK